MDTDPRREIAAAIGNLVFQSPVAFTFAGELVDVRSLTGWAGPMPQSPLAGGSGDPLVAATQLKLYDRCYAKRAAPQAAVRAHVADQDFARRLVGANAGSERWEGGWTIHQLGPDGRAFVRKGDRERVTMPGAFIFDGVPGATLSIGAAVSLRVPHESFDAQPGYYFAFGATLDELADSMALVRFYFHCGAQAAVSLVEELTGALNRFQTPFQLKTPAAPALYGRTDAAVLYVSARYVSIVTRIIARLVDKIPLEAATPLFTKRLWPGVGFAFEPGSGESFGSHRCRLVAEAIVGRWRQDGEQDQEARMTAIEARFAAVGLDLTRPWLGPDGIDCCVLQDSTRA